MAEEKRNPKADIIRGAVQDARDILNEPLDLGKLPLSKIPLTKGRVPEEWAGKLFDKNPVFPQSEIIDSWPFDERAGLPFAIHPDAKFEEKDVPLVYYDGEERHVVGTAHIKADGQMTAEVDSEFKLEGDEGLLGPFAGMAFSLGERLLGDPGTEVAITPGESDVDKVMKYFDENGIGPRDL